jgi:hypothetical protein
MLKLGMEKLKPIISKLLIAFVIFSVGFSFGKNHGNLKSSADSKTTASTKNVSGGTINVYYMHATFRCVTCNTIESMAKKLLQSNYKSELDNKKIQWKEVNFQKNEELAKRFGVVSSCIVVEADSERFERLDKVWTLMEQPDEFNSYISSSLNKYLTAKKAN